ncbi:MAG: hypothetical protein ABIP93_18210 [Gemmatimonadaceae bacterium]
MTHSLSRTLVAGAVLLASVGCQESNPTGTEASALSSAALAAALSSVPIGFGDLATSYVGSGIADAANAGLWVGGGRDAAFNRGDLMGGGLHDAFVGGIGFGGRGGQRGPFGGGLPCAGTFNAATGRVVCADETRNGVMISRSAQYLNVAGTAQQAFDTLTTNSVNTQSKVTGTITFDRAADSSSSGDRGKDHWGRGRGPGGRLLGDTSTILTASTTINSSSNRTVTGLAQGSTQRTVNGLTAGQETTTGTSSRGSFTTTRAVGDTTSGLIIPVATSTTQSYPTAGTVIRSIRATIKYTGESAVSIVRREVVTYDGSATAKIAITENGTTKNCTRALPRGPLTCS